MTGINLSNIQSKGLRILQKQISVLEWSKVLRTWGKLPLDALPESAEPLSVAAERLLLTKGATTTSRRICNSHLSEWVTLNDACRPCLHVCLKFTSLTIRSDAQTLGSGITCR